MSDINIGDLVRLKKEHDPEGKIGIVTDISPRYSHLVSHGKTKVIRIYWPTIDTIDWEYDFFLEKIDPKDLTEDKE
tara:strand:+ start:1457 stop:1684 length:228 start_codon:yes stop_codon:yes gene_type:complete